MKKALILFSVLLVLLGSGIIFFKLRKGERILGLSVTAPEFPDNYTIGSWLWIKPSELSQEQIENLIKFCQREKINTLFVSVDEYIEISEIKNQLERRSQEKEFNFAIDSLLDKTKSAGIIVYALAGNPKWTNPDLVYIPDRVIDFVIQYNKKNSRTRRFEGVQFDIEFYNQPDFSFGKQEVVLDYLKLVTRLVDKIKGYNKTSREKLVLSLVIPYWFDQKDGQILEVRWDDSQKPLVFHLADILNQVTGSSLAIMAYRDTPNGKNGSINISKSEVQYVQEKTANVSILIGQESGETEEKGISYNKKGKAAFKIAVLEIISAFKDYRVFKGIAIHSLSSYQTL